MAKVSNLLLLSAAMLAIAAGLNTYSGYAPADPNSTPLFSPLWWTRWFPLYASGAALLLVGLVLRVTLKAARIKDYHFSTAEPATAIIHISNYIDHHRQHNCG